MVHSLDLERSGPRTGSAAVEMIDHVECLFKLLDLILVEHGEHIAGCSLGSFLGCSSAASSLAGGHLVLVFYLEN